MNRRVWTGVIAGVLAATVLLTVGIGSYRAGQDDEVVSRTVENGEIVRVVDHGRDFFPGFFLFPLLLIGLVVLLARGGRRHGYGHGYGGGWGYGPGPGWHRGYGPGPCGPGPGPGDGPDARMQEWHRRMHEGAPATDPAVGQDPDDLSPGASGPDPRPPGDPGDPGERWSTSGSGTPPVT